MSLVLAGSVARHGLAREGWIEVDGSLVTAIGDGPPPRSPDERVEGLLSAGLVDLQVNGAAGHEVTGDEAALDAIEHTLMARGITSWLPTVITTGESAADRTVGRLARRVADPRSPIVGIHLEGPFLTPGHAGMHRSELLRLPADGVPPYVRHPAVRLVTLAPELPGALELVTELAAGGVTVSLGHSGADAATALRAVDAGARMVTHLFNAMAPLRPRAPGLAGLALTDGRVSLGLIADGAHLDPLVLRLVHAAAAGRVTLVSDASPAASAPARVTTFAGIALDPDGRAAGRRAGSLRLLDEDVGTWAAATGASRAAALEAAGERPAALAGLPAPLEPGAPADLVEWDPRGRARRVMRAGRWLAA